MNNAIHEPILKQKLQHNKHTVYHELRTLLQFTTSISIESKLLINNKELRANMTFSQQTLFYRIGSSFENQIT